MERDNLRPAGHPAGEFDGCFKRATSPLGKVAYTTASQPNGHNAGHFFCEFDSARIGYVDGMQKFSELTFYGLDDSWMPATYGIDCDPGCVSM